MLRKIKLSDHPFIYQSFLKSWVGERVFDNTPKMWGAYHDLMEKHLLSVGGYVICDDEDENLIYSWLVGDMSGLFYVYTRLPSRGQGYADQLIQHVFGVYKTQINILLDVPRMREFRRRFAHDRYLEQDSTGQDS